jgi:hypothetical protein
MLNLHTHSTASDGAFPPEQLPQMAVEAGLAGIALTDHDTTDGLAAFLRAGESIPRLLCVPGVELSCQPPDGGEIHLVGLCINPLCTELQDALRQIRLWRQERNARILQKLQELQMPLAPEDLPKDNTTDEVMGRPHIAMAMVRHGYCTSYQKAFDLFLRRGRPAYVPRQKISAYEAIEVIHRAGGIAVWAHPLSKSLTQVKFHAMLQDFRRHGLDSVEAWHPDQTPAKTNTIVSFAKELGLSLSGGTDFHGGSAHKGVFLSSVKGNPFPLPDKLPRRFV